MKYIIIYLCFFIVGCSTIPKTAWKDIKNNEKIYLNLKAGDIIIKEKQFSFLGMFGHVGIMKNENLIVNYPKLGKNIEILDINYWLEKNRKFLVLRYLEMTPEFQKQLLFNLNYYIYKNFSYKIHLNKYSDNGFYCSQFIWFLYFKTAQDLKINWNSKDSFIIFPYDFLEMRNFYIVN